MCGVGLKTGESFNISSGLQRTAEGLECFQMALQQKAGSGKSRRAHPQSAPVSPSLSQLLLTCRKQSTENALPFNEVKALESVGDIVQRYVVIYADTENTKTA